MKKLSLYIFLVLMVCNTVQALPKCKGTDFSKWTNCFGTYTNEEGRKYTGEFGNDPGKRHGKGSSKVYKDGNLVAHFVGQFKNDRANNGQGTYLHANGDKYVGGVKYGKMHGQGTYSHPNGDKYVGKYKDGKMHGQGTLIFPSGDKYIGKWENNKRHGKGTYLNANGAKHVGEYKDDKMHGQGTWTSAEGDKYVGRYKDGKKHGKGSMVYENGSTYVGNWKENFWHGQGSLTDASLLATYAGEFDKDKMMHGQGTFTFPDGDKWFGQWKDGKPDGQGTWTYKDGSVKKGVVKKDKLIKLTMVNKMSMKTGFDFICYNTCKDRNDEIFCRQKCSIQ